MIAPLVVLVAGLTAIQQGVPRVVALSVPGSLEGRLEVAVVCRDARRMWSAPEAWRVLPPSNTVRAKPGCRVMLRPSGGATYLASAELTGYEGAQRVTFNSEWLRTARAAVAPSQPYWVGAAAGAAECVRAPLETVCLFVPAGDAGALVEVDDSGIRFALSPAGAKGEPAVWQTARWGRLLRVTAPVASGIALRVTVLEPALRHGRDLLRETRISTAATIHRLGEGVFWIAGGPPEQGARLEVGAPLSAVERLDLAHVRGSPLTVLDVALSPEASIEGDVRSRGSLLAGATVSLMRLIAPPGEPDADEAAWAMERVGMSTTDATGRFYFRGLSREKHELVVSHPRRGRARLIVSAPSVQRVTVSPRSVVRGRVVQAGAPVAGAVVTVLPSYEAVTAARNPLMLFSEAAETGLDGRFEVLLPDEGRIALTAVNRNASLRVDLGEAGDLQPIVDIGDLRIEEPHDVTLLLDLPSGCVLAAAGPVGQPGMLLRRAELEGPGRWRLGAVLKGRWLIEVSCAGGDVPVTPAVIEITGERAELFRLEVRR